MKKSIFYLNILAFVLFLAAEKIEAVEVSAFEQTYFRSTGTPVTETNTFHKINGLAKIRVTNGGLEDADNEMVSSSEISLNGEVIIDASNFNQNVDVIEVEKILSGGINTIEVILKGKPGGALTVQVLAEAGDIDFDDDNFTGNEGDCNDADDEINPDAQEVCDGVDNNCDGQIDEGVKTTFYHDVDNDGYGNPNDTTEACEQPSGYVTDNTDCNDNDSNEHPNQTWYKDEDGDLYSDGTTDTTSCARPFGYKIEEELTATSGDCNDNDPNEHPGQTWYKDVDGDLYSDGTTDITSCVRPTGYKTATELTATTGDCNDSNELINPDAIEECDGIDNNCDGTVDEGLTFDLDGDGFTSFGSCEGTRDDCDDNDAAVNPGAAEIAYNGKDDDCNTSTPDDDLDNDGHTIATDCDDGNSSINPDAVEVCDGVDNNCNGQIDEGVKITYYADTDGDEYGDTDNAVLDCSQPSGYVTDNTDCNDDDVKEHPNQTWYKDADNDGYSDGTADTVSCTRPTGYKIATELTATSGDCNDNFNNIHPGATEVPDNGIDEDCNGSDIVTVPNVIGIDQTTAEASITAANLVVGSVTTDNSDTVPAGDVISQVPVGNTLVQEGTSVDLVVSLGSSGPVLSSLQIFPSTLVLTAQGEVHQLTVTGVYSDDSTKDITSSADGTTYATTDVNIADVSTEGLAIADNNGSATITISNNAISTQLVVTVNIQATPPYDPTAYITGRALDYNTGQPLVGADIKELTLATVVSTDAEGKFLYPVPQGGKYILFIEKPGYITAKKEVIVDSGKNTSIEESLTPYETFTTFIDAASGGVATNAAGTMK